MLSPTGEAENLIIRIIVLTISLAGLMPSRAAQPDDDVAPTPAPASSPASSPASWQPSKPIRTGSIVVDRGIGGSVVIVPKDTDAIVCPISAHSESNCYGSCSHKLMSRWKCATVNKPKSAPVVVPVSMAKQ
jgi:hypothetical protein